MDTQQGFAEVNGTRLYFEVTGTGRPIVLIHGFSLNLRMWDDQIEALSENYRVIRYDVRGFGKSAVPTDRNYSHADDLMALLEHLGESPRVYRWSLHGWSDNPPFCARVSQGNRCRHPR